MAWINRPKKKQTSAKAQLRRRLYNKAAWHRLSNYIRANQPLCEVCGNLATQVHHIQSPFEDGLPEIVRLNRLLSEANCVSLCDQCHDDIHKGRIIVIRKDDGSLIVKSTEQKTNIS